MRPTDVLQTEGWEDQALPLRAYVKGNARAAITQATLATIVGKVFDVSGGGDQVGSNISVNIASAVLDTPLTDDDGEYNFDVTVPGTYFPAGSRTYLVEIVFTPASGSPFPFVVEHTTKSLSSS